MLAVRGATQSSALFSIKRNIITVPTNNLLTWLTAWLIWFRWIVMVTAACLPLRQDKKTALVLTAFHRCEWVKESQLKATACFVSHILYSAFIIGLRWMSSRPASHAYRRYDVPWLFFLFTSTSHKLLVFFIALSTPHLIHAAGSRSQVQQSAVCFPPHLCSPQHVSFSFKHGYNTLLNVWCQS